MARSPVPIRDNRGVRVAVDLHCHLLPGIDDGARDRDDAVAMARQAQADGIAAICATPHIRHDHDVRIAELPSRLAELSAAVKAAGCRTRILPGAEVAVTALAGLDDAELVAVSLGGSGRWILLEPAPGPLDHWLELGLDPKVRQSGPEPARIGHISKQGSPQTRWALVEATHSVVLQPGPLRAFHQRIRAGRGYKAWISFLHRDRDRIELMTTLSDPTGRSRSEARSVHLSA